MHHYQIGYNDCIREIQRFMTDVEGLNSNDDRCIRLISYLQTRFRPDSSISGGAAYREALERLLNSRNRRLATRSHFVNRNEGRLLSGPAVSRFQPYQLTARPTLADQQRVTSTSGQLPLPVTPAFYPSVLGQNNSLREFKFNKFFS